MICDLRNYNFRFQEKNSKRPGLDPRTSRFLAWLSTIWATMVQFHSSVLKRGIFDLYRQLNQDSSNDRAPGNWSRSLRFKSRSKLEFLFFIFKIIIPHGTNYKFVSTCEFDSSKLFVWNLWQMLSWWGFFDSSAYVSNTRIT